jgi:hypothetical protein
MSLKKVPEPVVTKTGQTVTLNYCRKCMQNLPTKDFYDCVDAGFADANGLMSLCKDDIQKMYDELFAVNQSMEKTIHKLCTTLNVLYSNEAIDATKAHINTLLENGKQVSAIFSIYKMKLTAVKKSMTKTGLEDQTYEDIATIYTTAETINTKEILIPREVMEFWGKDTKKEDVEFLENEFLQFKQTHKADTRAEVVLLKQVCYTVLDINNLRKQSPPGDTSDLVKELQALMKSLTISPSAANAAGGKGQEAFGLWIQDIEREEPAQWLKTDPRGNIYRDVGNVEEYFQNYVVRPIKNFMGISKDFNIDDKENEEMDTLDDGMPLIDDGELDDDAVTIEKTEDKKTDNSKLGEG